MGPISLVSHQVEGWASRLTDTSCPPYPNPPRSNTKKIPAWPGFFMPASTDGGQTLAELNAALA